MRAVGRQVERVSPDSVKVLKHREGEQDSSLTLKAGLLRVRGELRMPSRGADISERHVEREDWRKQVPDKARAGATQSPGRGLDPRGRKQHRETQAVEKKEAQGGLAVQAPTEGGGVSERNSSEWNHKLKREWEMFTAAPGKNVGTKRS